jgi:hypothetical protein
VGLLVIMGVWAERGGGLEKVQVKLIAEELL